VWQILAGDQNSAQPNRSFTELLFDLVDPSNSSVHVARLASTVLAEFYLASMQAMHDACPRVQFRGR
jgi:hypothetical protein